MVKIEKIDYTYKIDRLVFSSNPSEKGGVYLLFDKSFELIYIGQTLNFRRRLSQHLSKFNNGRNLDSLEQIHGQTSKIPSDECKYYLLINSCNKLVKNMVEDTLIYFFKPKYNKNLSNEGDYKCQN